MKVEASVVLQRKYPSRGGTLKASEQSLPVTAGVVLFTGQTRRVALTCDTRVHHVAHSTKVAPLLPPTPNHRHLFVGCQGHAKVVMIRALLTQCLTRGTTMVCAEFSGISTLAVKYKMCMNLVFILDRAEFVLSARSC